jgi:V8-like Glu-specific endopeptidase
MPNPGNEVESTTIFEVDAMVAMAAVEEYWTPARMADAQPIPVEIEGAAVAMFASEFVIEGERQSQKSTVGQNSGVAQLSGSLINPLSTNTSKVTDRSVIPYAAVGKMFMRFDGTNYVGSAWTIAERAVFTAGHCVFDRDGGGWADAVKFVPQYDAGAEPLGNWIATRLHALKGWTENRQFEYDLAVFEVDRPIRPETGSLGWMANYPPNQGPYTAIGYPAATPFDGQDMWQSVGAYIDGSNPIQMHNDMTGGCSGGPWEVVENGDIYTNGLNSFRYTSNPRTMYSPHFGEGFLNLYNTVKDLT